MLGISTSYYLFSYILSSYLWKIDSSHPQRQKTLYIFSADNFFLSIIYPQLVGCTAVEASDMEVSPQCLNTLHL